jgi:hypothetical protein
LKIDPEAAPDTSLGRLCDLALQRPASRCDPARRPTEPPAPDPGGVGAGPEQAAALFAVLARSRGLPSRISIGFATTSIDGPSATIRGQDLSVRPEVLFEDFGWVAFDPAPRGSASAPPPPAAAAGTDVAPPAPCSDLRCVIDQQAQPQPDPPVDERPADPAEPGLSTPRSARALLGVLAAALVVSLPLAAIVAAKAIRRARRRRGPPRARAQGAWDEVVDRLVELRIPVPLHAGPGDAARMVSTSRPDVGTDMTGLASLLGPALWAADEPDPKAASAAWSSADQIRRRLVHGLGPLPRLRAAASLAPLRRGQPGRGRERTRGAEGRRSR